ncbi:hypothetical protein C4J93_3475 [Pseudomonas sp. R2-37-08W]|uniref:hypothetical protein n=1 Tax=Pseudomonas sp. R2-37-08W TaxID=1173273 RepID=UPI000F55C253|nr:hypothetical protein [Pseudomonas sp. R2-37-08W]AZF11665.1 hypothetical protein C4J93_3475 [Pseudomonas sp. R2-37-08W]
MNTYNGKVFTTPMLERHLAVKQIQQYHHLQQSVLSTSDKQEFRRATNIIDKLSTEYGASLLHEARAQLK